MACSLIFIGEEDSRATWKIAEIELPGRLSILRWILAWKSPFDESERSLKSRWNKWNASKEGWFCHSQGWSELGMRAVTLFFEIPHHQGRKR
jgi:hypothetical protein